MKVQTFLFLLVVGVAIYLVSQGPTELLEKIGIHGGEEEALHAEEEGGLSSSGDAMAYVRRNVGHACRKSNGNAVVCLIKNGGSEELFSITIEIGASTGGQSAEELYALEAQGPFPPKQDTTLDIEIPSSEPIQWLSSRSEIVAAEFNN